MDLRNPAALAMYFGDPVPGQIFQFIFHQALESVFGKPGVAGGGGRGPYRFVFGNMIFIGFLQCHFLRGDALFFYASFQGHRFRLTLFLGRLGNGYAFSVNHDTDEP